MKTIEEVLEILVSMCNKAGYKKIESNINYSIKSEAKKIKILLYDSSGENHEYTLLANMFDGYIILILQKEDKEIAFIECKFDDLHRAWNAVNRYP